MNFSIINKILASFIVLACFTLAYNLAFTDFMETKIIGGKRIFFIVLLIAYAGFRIYRIAKSRND
jgi:hypothetical protein